jgi:hypothetical protein
MYENSVIVFSTDNGGAIENISNLPLRVSTAYSISFLKSWILIIFEVPDVIIFEVLNIIIFEVQCPKL